MQIMAERAFDMLIFITEYSTSRNLQPLCVAQFDDLYAIGKTNFPFVPCVFNIDRM